MIVETTIRLSSFLIDLLMWMTVGDKTRLLATFGGI